MFRISKNLCSFSPSGKYLATVLQNELSIKISKSGENYHLFTFLDTIEYIEWCQNDQLILCASPKKAFIQVFSIKQPEWVFKYTEGSAGIDSVSWGPDYKSLIIISEFKIQVSILTLDDHRVTHILNLKSSVKHLDANEFSKQLAVIVATNGEENVEIYKAEGWKLSRKLICDKLFAIDGISWSPNGELLGIWCSTIGKSRLLIYSTVTDSHIGAFSSENNSSIDQLSTSIYANSSEKPVRGIEHVVWSPSGQLVAIAGNNETVALVNHITWSVILQLYCSPVIKDGNYLGRVFKEVDISRRDWSTFTTSTFIIDHHIRYLLEEVHERPINVLIDGEPKNWEVSIATFDILKFSPCGKYLAIRHQVYPTTLWIWDVLEDVVDNILLKNSVSGIAWEPTKTRLLIFSESSTIIEWKPNKKATCFESPRGMKVVDGKWNPNGELIVLVGYNKSSVICLKD
ncbi:WD repeat-containing protein WRAP73-like [Chelonus insularis]|uniref:WD repeat-containing protein WRAP73-like n=1 Tax=Chelonus insularis TaxID=460826 RepID=UPI00158B2E1C|nr:WD repeat-containing protein WRAP73-like [Chelonus insularis]